MNNNRVELFSPLITGTIDLYNGNATMGNGLSAVVGNVDLPGQGAAITSTNLFLPPANGVYEVSVYQVCTTGGGGTLITTLGWTDDAQAQSGPITSSSLTLGSFAQATAFLRAKSTAFITYSTAISGLSGSPKYGLFIATRRIS